mmetsp:Transcript_16612/g.27233  ORF Transcript_16612/g.27233 Transcript_16612/m.27233 type:complete len:169 (+) Transcript_16612:465-971(+)
MKDTNHESTIQRIRGVVLDSCPSDITPDIATRGYVGALLAVARNMRSSVTGQRLPFPGYFHPTLTPVCANFFAWYLSRPSIIAEQAKLKEILASNTPKCPHLYMYGPADELIPSSGIEEYMQTQRNRGIKVSSKQFESSNHVEHYRMYHDEYQKELLKFWQTCTSSKK